MRLFPALAATCCLALSQQPSADPAQAQQQELALAFQEANGSPGEILHVIEHFLLRYPSYPDRARLEHDAARAAVALHDDALAIRYGEMSLARTPDDMVLLPAVSRSLLSLNTREGAERALKYARRAEELARQYRKSANPSNLSPIEWHNQADRALARALTDDARATAYLDRADEALATARLAFETYPNADSAREVSSLLERMSKPLEAAAALADAFTVPDPQATDAERARDRVRMGDLYRKGKGSNEHLGDLILEAYDRNSAKLQARERSLHENEPNPGITDPMALTLSAVEGKSLQMASLKGKVVVLDMWATWCFPCREQHPLYEQVKARFRDNPSVVFLSIDTDTDHLPVKSFMKGMQWEGPAYFEDGMLRIFAPDSMPTTLILGRNGKLFTRMNGYVKEHFVELLTERIRDALASK